jgi:hypothetical protein
MLMVLAMDASSDNAHLAKFVKTHGRVITGQVNKRR